MKRHITEVAIESAVAYWKSLAELQKNSSGAQHEAYLAAQVAFTECFSILTRQSWISADVMLRKRAGF